ncbi:unannotated protein [freshwater metagenome]|uniref:Unannotated protein n=1 Tax=freshwater metagenome TaxID=449393 RepID=A0A6J6JME9_9ZZZZ
MTEIDRRIGGQTVQILLALNIFHPRALRTFCDNRQRVVIMSEKRVLES